MKRLLLSLLLILPTFSQATETCVAVKPYAVEIPGVNRLWGRNSDFWPQRATLRIKFVDGSKSQQDRAWFRFAKVDALVNLTFVRVANGDSEARVSFNPNNGHWSYLGRYNAKISQSQVTMNLALRSGVFGDYSNEWDRVAIHECLHLIGFGHEHQSPQALIDWNRPVVYADYLRTQGWSRSQTDFQVLNRSDPADFNGSAFDPKSIMQYPVPKEHILSGKPIGWNRKLTETDLRILREVYPQ